MSTCIIYTSINISQLVLKLTLDKKVSLDLHIKMQDVQHKYQRQYLIPFERVPKTNTKSHNGNKKNVLNPKAQM